MYYNVLFVRSEFVLPDDIRNKYSFYCVSPHTASSLDEGLHKIERYNYDCVIDEVTLPYKWADDQLYILRESTQAPILALVHGHDYSVMHHCLLVADDCVWEPFTTDEIIARAAALVEKGSVPEQREIQDRPIQIHDMMILPKFKKVLLCEHPILLTATEYRILLLLARNRERIISQMQIYDSIWSDSEFYEAEKAVSYHIGNIRKKIACFTDEKYIETVRSFGYRLADPSANQQMQFII